MNEELGFFYDNIHGRISLEELPLSFHPALKAVLSSPALDRLKRISQLGHTSLSYFSATHTRFSHALGTMLVMNKLFTHIRNRRGLHPEVFVEAEGAFSKKSRLFKSVEDFVHCHLLLAAMYQDVGELPFQKITSLYFRPAHNEVQKLRDKLKNAQPNNWRSCKNIFSMMALLRDMQTPGELETSLNMYSIDFLAFLVTGDGCPNGATHLHALRQMVDGGIDADRIDYVYRDASVTIGSLSRPTTVLESIASYTIDNVVVCDPRPVVDFLSTRMRLWTFVYSAPDVRFRQALLKTFLQGRLDSPDTPAQFCSSGLDPELSYAEFLAIDDHSLMLQIDKCRRIAVKTLKSFRLIAAELLLKSTLDYECRILERPDEASSPSTPSVDALPDELFFDLFRDHDGLQLHRSGSIKVQQSLTSSVDVQIAIERTSGALSPMFTETSSALLVPKSFYIFRPKKSDDGHWPLVDSAIADKSLYWKLRWADAERELGCKTDTRSEPGFDTTTRALSISYCSVDFECVTRIIQELCRQERRYRLFLRPFDGTGSTPAANSADLIAEADAVLALVSVDYLSRAVNNKSYIAIEVRSIHARAKEIPIVPLGLDERVKLDAVPNWDWGAMNERWRGNPVVIPNQFPLRNANDSLIKQGLKEALHAVDNWKP